MRQIPIAPEVRRYAIAVVMATHPEHELAAPMTKQFVQYGSSPRGAQAIILGAKLRAILDNRYHVAREDIKAVAPMALRHRIILNFEGQAESVLALSDAERDARQASEGTRVMRLEIASLKEGSCRDVARALGRGELALR